MRGTVASMRRGVAPLAILGVAVLLVAVPAIPTTCPLRLLLHVPCPSCGLTRAARLALAGDLAGATRMHPLWFLVLPFAGIVSAGEAWAFVQDGEWGAIAGRAVVKRAGMALVLALVLVWVARWMGAFGGPVSI